MNKGRNKGMKYPWRATDDIRELFDELAGLGDDFVGLLLCGVAGEKIGRQTNGETKTDEKSLLTQSSRSLYNTIVVACVVQAAV